MVETKFIPRRKSILVRKSPILVPQPAMTPSRNAQPGGKPIPVLHTLDSKKQEALKLIKDFREENLYNDNNRLRQQVEELEMKVQQLHPFIASLECVLDERYSEWE